MTGYTDTHGRYLRVTLLHGAGVPAIDKATPVLVGAIGELAHARRVLEGAHATVDRLGDDARAEAVSAGTQGKKLDKGAMKKRRKAAEEALEDAELEVLTAGGRVSQLHADYQAALMLHTPAIKRVARDTVDAAMLSLTTALEMTRAAQARLDGATTILAGMSQLAVGMPVPMNAPRDLTDDLDDAGYPGVWAEAATEPLTKAVGWASRWVTRYDDEEKAAKVAAKEAAAAEKAAKAADDFGGE